MGMQNGSGSRWSGLKPKGIVAGLVALVILGWPSPTRAALVCHPLGNHRVCLETVRRSAKYFWQYQVVVSIDGQPQPQQPYDCRPQAPPPSLGTDLEVSATDLRDLVCRTVQPRR